jgi:predicted Rossmann fold flavoprotein
MGARIIVVGGGAAGLMAAGRAAELGGDVLLLEKMPRAGLKLGITGKGRCNLTNASTVADHLGHLGPHGAFMRNAYARFFVAETLAFFDARGVATVTERGQRVFPASQRALDVVAALRAYCLEQHVQFRYQAAVAEIVLADGAIAGARVGERVFDAGALILATGGMSYPRTGSTGDGYRLAAQVGHTVTTPRPGLVPLVLKEAFVPRLEGLSLRNVRASLYQGERLLASEFGELVFTADGVSGPIILTLSMVAVDALARGPLRLAIDLKPALDEAELDERVQRDLAALGKASYPLLLKGLLPRSLIEVFAERSGIPAECKLSQLTTAQRQRLVSLLKAFPLTVVATRPVDEAIITLGGVVTKEIDPATMASRRVPGLCFAGEIIDVAGDTGGYNLQVAFTSGYLAGESAARYVSAMQS